MRLSRAPSTGGFPARRHRRKCCCVVTFLGCPLPQTSDAFPASLASKVVAVPEVDRHPLYVAYYTQLERENTRCLLRASARNKMKRFITDVHTVWLTNLSHHPEFRRMVRGAAANQEHGGDYDANGRGGQTPPATPGTASSRRGLDGGRDSAAIAASQSQIQSVQPERAFRAAFFYSSGSRDSSSSQPAAERTRQGDEQRRAGQLAAHTSMSYEGVDDTEGGEPPELPPPPLTAPTLAVLVAERRQLAAVSTSGSGNARKSLGGGPRRRSLTGGGAVGVGGGDVGSWLDMSTRMLRVLRFAPPPLAIPVVEAAEGEGGGEGAPLPPPGIGESPLMPPSSSGATWMISSFHPHDGTETRVTIADCAVTKVVGEALSASCPLVMTGPSRVGGTQAGTGSGRAAVSSRTSPSAPQGRGEEGARLLVLRRGVRVPVLGGGGGVVGKVLSVVEVRASLLTKVIVLRMRCSSVGTTAVYCKDVAVRGGTRYRSTTYFLSTGFTLHRSLFCIFSPSAGRTTRLRWCCSMVYFVDGLFRH